MKHLLLTTIAAVVLAGCGPSEAERALVSAAGVGDLEAVKQHLAAGVDVNAKLEASDHLNADRFFFIGNLPPTLERLLSLSLEYVR
jgi:multidrug efflux pump subunit AcrA (membrane-fusion protein)